MRYDILKTDIIPTKIFLAVKLTHDDTLQHVHNNRLSHGFVYNSGTHTRYNFSDGRKLDMCDRNFLYLPKYSSYVVETESFSYTYCVNFDVVNDDKFEPFTFGINNHERIVDYYERMVKYYLERPEPERSYKIRALINELVVLLLHENEYTGLTPAQELLISRAMRYIDESFSNPTLSISALSEYLGVSEVYLRRLFHMRFDCSPLQYIKNKRLEHSKSLLMSGRLPLDRISELSGFTNSSYFCHEFKAACGVTPTEYRWKRGEI